MDEQRAIQKLIELGMYDREARLYLALLRTPEATPAILHRISGVPRTKTYEALERLVARGFCGERQEGRRKYFRATRPTEVFSLLRRSWEQEHKQRCETGEMAFNTLDELYKQSSKSDSTLEHIEVIRSKDQINGRFLALMRGCQSQVLSFTRSPYTAGDETMREEVKQVQHEAFARGVRIRTIYMVETKEWQWLENFISELEGAGESVQLIDDLPMKMFVFDHKTALIALPSVPGLTGSDFSMLSVEDPGFIQACSVLFETYWERSSPVTEWIREQRIGISGEDQR